MRLFIDNKIVNLHQFTIFWSDEDEEYVALNPEYPLLSGLAKTIPEAIAELCEAIDMAEEIKQEELCQLSANFMNKN